MSDSGTTKNVILLPVVLIYLKKIATTKETEKLTFCCRSASKISKIVENTTREDNTRKQSGTQAEDKRRSFLRLHVPWYDNAQIYRTASSAFFKLH